MHNPYRNASSILSLVASLVHVRFILSSSHLPIPAGVFDMSWSIYCPNCINQCVSLLLTGPETLSSGENIVLLINRTFGRLDPLAPFCLGSLAPIQKRYKSFMYNYRGHQSISLIASRQYCIMKRGTCFIRMRWTLNSATSLFFLTNTQF